MFVHGPGVTPKAIAFLATRDAKASRRFYEQALGLRFIDDDDFALVFDAFGTMLRIQKTPEVVTAPYTAFGLEVDDLAANVTALLEKGLNPRRYPGLDQDPHGIWTSPSGAKVAWFADPDGHVVSLSQFA